MTSEHNYINFQESFLMLEEAMEVCDIDTADQVMQALSYYDIPEEMQNDYEELKIAVADIDEGAANQHISNMRKKI